MASNAVGGGAIDAEGFLKYLLHFHRTGYTRALNVTQRAAGANMSVDVNVDSESYGGALFATTAGVPYFGYTNAAINATVATADPTNPRKDIVVAYIDLSLITTGTTNNLGAFKVKVVTGTAAASPSDPNAAAIQASVGAGNPYIQLARVSLTAALGSITNAVITDLRTPAANAMPYLYGGSSNTVGHLVPNLADGTVVVTTGTGNVSNTMLAMNAVTGSKISTYKTIEQVVTTNSTPTTAVIQEGWSWVTGNAVSTLTKAITFPQTFTTITQFQTGIIGARTTSDPTAITDFNVPVGGELLSSTISTISTTGVTVQIYKNVNFSTGVRYGFWWRAIGT